MTKILLRCLRASRPVAVPLQRRLGRSYSRILGRDPVYLGEVSPMMKRPPGIPQPEYAVTGKPNQSQELYCYSPNEIVKVRRAARLARNMLEYANSLVRPGITTDEIDRLTYAEIVRHGAYPTPLNYCGFPKSICTSVNEVLCHGIPDNRILVEGDIISIDVSVYLDGFHGDNCGTVGVGNIDDAAKLLIGSTKGAVDAAIAAIGPGICLSTIGKTIEEYAHSKGFVVNHEFCGHGTGKYIHMLPFVMHYTNSVTLPLRPGMVFTIEPILVEGTREIVHWRDGWTVSSKDCSRSAQIEHEVLITESGVEVLTVLEED